MLFEQILIEEKIDRATFMELNSVEAIKRCVLYGIGVAMIPVMAIKQEIKQKRLTVLPWPQEKLKTGILMIWHKDKWISPALESFMNMVREVLKSREVD
jgi:DNA-binding transcriptional LysR family regulator